MTEMVNGEGQGSSNFAPAPVSTPSSTQSSSAPAESERTFKQSEVNDLVGRARHEAIERYRRDASMAARENTQQTPQQSQYQQPYQPQYQTPPQQPPQGQYRSDEDIRRLAAEEAQRSRNEWIQESHRNAEEQNAQRIASEFFTKVGSGEGGVQAFEKLVNDSGLDLRAIPYHVQLANMVDNTREVMVDLIANPAKIGQIQNLIDIDIRAGRQPRLALAEMKRLSESIKTNEKAGSYRSPNEPLSQMRPSNAGTDNKGALSVSDYKRKYRV